MPTIKTEELVEVPSYINGEKFVFSVPDDIATLDCKLNPKADYYDDPWSPWPTKKGVIRRMGNFLLKLHDTKTKEKGWGSNLRKVPLKLVREVSENPDIWYEYSINWDEKNGNSGLPTFNGRHVLSVLKEDYPELEQVHGTDWQKTPYGKKHQELRTPTPIPKEILAKVYGRSRPRVEISFTNFEHADRRNRFQLELEWYRKELLKIQRKLGDKAKKEQAEELGVTVADIEEQKRKEAEIARAALLTQEWVDTSKEVFKTIDFLNDVVRQMGQRQPLDREWFDKGRRDMRELANTMRPLNKHFAKDAE